MHKLLIFLVMPPEVTRRYGELVSGLFPGVRVEVVRTREEAESAIVDADILMTFGVMMTDGILAKARRLKWVHALGTGVDGIVDQPSLPPNVTVTSTRGIHGVPMTEATIMMMLALSRKFPRSLRLQDQAKWERWPSRLLHDKTVGILGVGLIAEHLAPVCKAFGMTVIGISRTARDVPGIDRYFGRGDLIDAVRLLDYFVLLVPYSPETHNIIDASVFAAMKPDSYLVNVARGGVVDEAAMLDALKSGRIAGAALDTFATEPLPPDHPLWKAPNTIITAHLGGFCDVYVEHALPQFETNMRQFLAGRLDGMINVDRRGGL